MKLKVDLVSDWSASQVALQILILVFVASVNCQPLSQVAVVLPPPNVLWVAELGRARNLHVCVPRNWDTDDQLCAGAGIPTGCCGGTGLGKFVVGCGSGCGGTGARAVFVACRKKRSGQSRDRCSSVAFCISAPYSDERTPLMSSSSNVMSRTRWSARAVAAPRRRSRAWSPSAMMFFN